jgi:hypothetical protein
MRLADPDDLSEGLVFDERVAEDFNLSTGIWVHAGGVRVAVLAAAAPSCRTPWWPAMIAISSAP